MRRTSAAFSLIELMCAILVLGVGLVGLGNGIVAALRSSKECERQTTAVLLAAGQVETLRAEGFLTTGETEGEEGRYRWKQSVSLTAIEGLYDVEVNVEDGETREGIYALRTLVFDPPVDSATPPVPAGSGQPPGRRSP